MPFCLLAAWAACTGRAAEQDWPVHLGDPSASHYSALRQIDRANVARLAPVWTFRTGEAASDTQMPCNPLVIDGVLYGTSPQLKLLALHAASGHLRWRFDPRAGRPGPPTGRGLTRGLATWADGPDRRLFYTADGFLHALDASTGRLIDTFGDGGRLDLLAGLDLEAANSPVLSAAPGVVYRDLFIVSTRLAPGSGATASAHLRAYDVRTGARRWIFNTIPRPGTFGHATWPAGARPPPGGAGHDAGLTLDAEGGLVFIPTGPASTDFRGGDRAGANLFGNCLLALEAATGRRRWHFQFVHHDLWSSILPAPPTLCTLTRAGRKIPAVVQITSSGHVWAFHRETGESLFPWREQPAPSSALAGETTPPTQPLPLHPAPFTRQSFTEADATTRSPAAHAAVRARLRELTPHTPFAPPDTRGTIKLAAFAGDGENAGGAVDPDAVLYLNASEAAWTLQLHPTRAEGGVPLGQMLYTQLCVGCHGPDRAGNAATRVPSLLKVGTRLRRGALAEQLREGRGVMPPYPFLTDAQLAALIDFLLEQEPASPPARGVAPDRATSPTATSPDRVGYTTAGWVPLLDPDGFPALRPPWGTLNALDLNTGEYRWRRPLGAGRNPAAASGQSTGTENDGGPLVTAGGLVFIGATPDEKFRAFDAATGQLRWEFALPAGGYATPATYSVAGRQYVVIACGGGRFGTKPGDAYVAFALPPD